MSEGVPLVDPLIGLNIVGSYVVRNKLAEGGMGAVYVAVNELGNKKVVKVLLPAASQHPQIRDRFEREARAAARLRGRPHIVEIDDVGRLPNGQQFLTMEFLHGRPLDEHLHKNGRVSPHHAFMIVTQIGRGLHELHTAGIVHRDLKPGNVFLQTNRDDRAFYVKLIDLGIAHDATLVERSDMRTMTGMSMGTPGYMAPEQYTDAGSVTPTADIYALAIILAELLTGARPWDAPNPSMLFHMQQTQPPNIANVDMPPAWRPIMLSALASNPGARPQTVYAFLAALASELPGDERLGVESGAQMMASWARSLLAQAPADSETVRAHGQAPVLWSPGKVTPAPMTATPAPHGAMQPAATPHLGAASWQPETRNERPGAPAPISTIGGASGVMVAASQPPRARRTGIVLAAVGALVVAGVATFGVARALRNDSTTTEPSTSESATQPAAAPAASPDAAQMATVADAGIDAAPSATDATISPVMAWETPPDAGVAASASASQSTPRTATRPKAEHTTKATAAKPPQKTTTVKPTTTQEDAKKKPDEQRGVSFDRNTVFE